MPHPLRIGLKLSQQVHPIEAQREAWRIADEAGFDHIWPFDHLIALGKDPTKLILTAGRSSVPSRRTPNARASDST